MEDLETHSAWSHVLGRALLGKLKGTQLRMVPSVQTSWKEWYQEHPRTRVLKKSREIRASVYQKYAADPNRTGLFRAHYLMGRLPAKTLVAGIALQGDALAVTLAKIRREKILQTKLADRPVLISYSLDGGVRAYLAAVDGTRLNFAERQNRVSDKQTGSFWDLETGRALEGPLKGKQLSAIPLTMVYWFAWSSFYPNTKVID